MHKLPGLSDHPMHAQNLSGQLTLPRSSTWVSFADSPAMPVPDCLCTSVVSPAGSPLPPPSAVSVCVRDAPPSCSTPVLSAVTPSGFSFPPHPASRAASRITVASNINLFSDFFIFLSPILSLQASLDIYVNSSAALPERGNTSRCRYAFPARCHRNQNVTSS